MKNSRENEENSFNRKYDRIQADLNGLTNLELSRKRRYWNERCAAFRSYARMALFTLLVMLLLMCLLDIAAYKSGVELGFINVSVPFDVFLLLLVVWFGQLKQGMQFRLNVLEDIIKLRNENNNNAR